MKQHRIARRLLWLPLAGLALALVPRALVPRAQESAEAGWNEVVSNDGTYRLSWKSDPEVIEFGERFELEVKAERTDGEPLGTSLAFDARMPEHGHGMNREPEVEDLGGGHFKIGGLLFHMPGYWELYFDFTAGAITERAQAPLEID